MLNPSQPKRTAISSLVSIKSKEGYSGSFNKLKQVAALGNLSGVYTILVIVNFDANDPNPPYS